MMFVGSVEAARSPATCACTSPSSMFIERRLWCQPPTGLRVGARASDRRYARSRSSGSGDGDGSSRLACCGGGPSGPPPTISAFGGGGFGRAAPGARVPGPAHDPRTFCDGNSASSPPSPMISGSSAVKPTWVPRGSFLRNFHGGRFGGGGGRASSGGAGEVRCEARGERCGGGWGGLVEELKDWADSGRKKVPTSSADVAPFSGVLAVRREALSFSLSRQRWPARAASEMLRAPSGGDGSGGSRWPAMAVRARARAVGRGAWKHVPGDGSGGVRGGFDDDAWQGASVSASEEVDEAL